MDFNKIVKWGKSALRVFKYKVRYRNQLKFDCSKSRKPVYFGKGVDISIDKDCSLQIGGGTYLSDNCRIVVMDSSNPAVIGSKNYFGIRHIFDGILLYFQERNSYQPAAAR